MKTNLTKASCLFVASWLVIFEVIAGEYNCLTYLGEIKKANQSYRVVGLWEDDSCAVVLLREYKGGKGTSKMIAFVESAEVGSIGCQSDNAKIGFRDATHQIKVVNTSGEMIGLPVGFSADLKEGEDNVLRVTYRGGDVESEYKISIHGGSTGEAVLFHKVSKQHE